MIINLFLLGTPLVITLTIECFIYLFKHFNTVRRERGRKAYASR